MRERRQNLHRRMLWPLAALCLLLSVMFAGTAQAAIGDNYRINVKGTYHYTQAYNLLNQINTLRTKTFNTEKNPLVQDEELMQKAMLRAAELACLYSEEMRPNGEDALDITAKASQTNVLFGAETADAAMTALSARAAAKNNMINTTFKSVGIGCFSTGGNFYWCLLYSTENSEKQVKHADTTQTASIQVIEYVGRLKLAIAGDTFSNPTAGTATLYVGKKVDITPLWVDGSKELPSGKQTTIEIEDSTFNWTTSNAAVATVSTAGQMKGVSVGTCTITGKPKSGTGKGISVTVTVKKNTIKSSLKNTVYTYTGGKIYPQVTVKRGKKTLTKGKDYTLSYKKNKSVGYGRVTVNGKGTYDGQTETLIFQIIPSQMKLKAKAYKGYMKLSWSKSSQASGYEIKIATNKKMTSNVILEELSSSKKSVKVKNLTSGKNYYVRIRQYKTVSGERIYGKWSSRVKVKIK